MRSMVAFALGLCVVGGPALGADLVGRWDFENSLAPTTGTNPLTAGVSPVQYQAVTINGVNGTAATWPQGTPANADEQFFTVTNPIGPNGPAGAAAANQYTVVMDVLFPAAGWTSLVQTNAADAHQSDGDWFINPGAGMGISGDYTDAGNDTRFPFGQWARVAWSVDTTGTNTYRSFINGQLQNVVQSPSGFGADGRYALGDVFHVFADEDGETNAGSISTLLLYNGALSDAEVAALGGPQAVPEPASAALAALAGVLLLARRRR